VTIVGYGAMTHVALEAAEILTSDGVSAEVIDLRTLRPWDRLTVANSVARTHRAVIVEESAPVCGIASEIAASLYEKAFDELDAPIERVSASDTPIPYAKNLEQACLPHAADVVAAARRTLGR
jgi:pyruvate dehydrogenase E1 component beta subunit